jgi:hypothetical protein
MNIEVLLSVQRMKVQKIQTSSPEIMDSRRRRGRGRRRGRRGRRGGGGGRNVLEGR